MNRDLEELVEGDTKAEPTEGGARMEPWRMFQGEPGDGLMEAEPEEETQAEPRGWQSRMTQQDWESKVVLNNIQDQYYKHITIPCN